MSEDEKAASIGKLMLEWKSSNEKMGAIEAEFLRHSEVFCTCRTEHLPNGQCAASATPWPLQVITISP